MVKAQETYLETLLEGKKQYQVPLYQRVYAWEKKDRDRLWSDIVELVETRRVEKSATHFIGSVVLSASPSNAIARMQKYLVVDGQQRLTTLSLLLAALRDHLVTTGDTAARDSYNAQYLLNVYEPETPAKLLPTQADRTSYLAVVGNAPQAGGDDNVGSAYRFFRSKISEFDDPDDPNDLVELEDAVLRGLAVVAVTAEASDNAYRIFESLNYTGKPLTQADLLKNYLFMRLDDRAELIYNTLWRPLETKLSAKDLELLFWLDLVQTDEKAKQTEIYAGQQKRLSGLSASQVEQEVRRIGALGDVLALVLNPVQEPDSEIRQRLEHFNAWGSQTALPLLVHLLARRSAGEATRDQVLAAMVSLESYFVRRIIVGRATAGLNRTLLQAVRTVAEADEIDVALRRFLSVGRKHFATDAQIRQAVQSVAFYWQGRGPQKKLILQWLEDSYGSKEAVDPAKLTIEHVLPQSLTATAKEQFAACLEEGADVTYEHERLVHTLGNLTLTGYNSELSNRPFAEKREMLAASGLLMNQEIAAHDTWGPAEITARAAELATRIIELWPGPDESLTSPANEETSELRATVADILAAVPAGRWTSYGEVAIVAGTYPQPVAAVLVHYELPNAWRVLQAAGTVSPGFFWRDPTRTEPQAEALIAEGVQFDHSGRALPAQFLTAHDLAAAAGLEIDDESAPWRDAGNGTTGGIGPVQEAFYTELRALGTTIAKNIRSWQTPRPQHWYDISLGSSRANLSLTVNSQLNRVGVELYIRHDKALFARLLADREAIEAEIGLTVEWFELPNRKASRVIATHPGDFRDPVVRPDLQRWMIETADVFTWVFRARL